jgi:hypothetical protein
MSKQEIFTDYYCNYQILKMIILFGLQIFTFTNIQFARVLNFIALNINSFLIYHHQFRIMAQAALAGKHHKVPSRIDVQLEFLLTGVSI